MSSPAFLKSLWFKYLLIVILPIAAMFYFQIGNFVILALGETVLLGTRPVGTREILSGDYVTLS